MKQWTQRLNLFIVLFSCICFYGCAFFIKGADPVSVQVLSSTKGASCDVYSKQTDDKIATITTPATVLLKKKQGYFLSPTYKINCILQNYQAQEALIEGSLTGWYMGNILFFPIGLVGMFVVDPMSGAMWTLEPQMVFFDYEDPNKSILNISQQVPDRGFRTRPNR